MLSFHTISAKLKGLAGLLPVLFAVMAMPVFAQSYIPSADRQETVSKSADSTASYTPPIGIPMPPFGIYETAPDLPSPWNGDTAGFYYVKSGGGNSGNGYPANPRNSIPNGLPAGAVVVIEGQYNTNHSSGLTLNGTLEAPIFIISSAADQAILKQKFQVGGSYYIIDGINAEWDNSSGNGKMNITGSYAVVKNGDFRGDTNKGVGSVNISNGDHVLFYNNNVHIAGDWKTTDDQDTHAMGISTNISYVWVLDNKFSRSSGDGIQINAGNAANQPNTHHIYIGRNEAFENKQNGFWTKQATDVIFSENIARNHVATTSSAPGVGIGAQYGPERVWFLYNKIYDNYGGITVASRSDGVGEYIYIIGNRIYNNLNPNFDVENSWANAGITITGGEKVAILNNVLVNNSGGINTPVGSGEFLIYNNIIDLPSAEGANSIFFYESGLAATSYIDNNIFNEAALIRWGRAYQDDLSSFRSAFNKCLSCEETDPLYNDPQTGDFTLRAGSPAIDAGNVNAAYDTFFDLYGINIKVDPHGISRPQNGQWDIGVFEFDDGTTSLSGEENKAILPRSVSVYNYPNPFNPGTVIRYELPRAANVELAVYNLAGKRLVRLDYGFRTAGSHSLSWDARDDRGRQVASGLYLLRIQAGQSIKTLKMMYLR